MLGLFLNHFNKRDPWIFRYLICFIGEAKQENKMQQLKRDLYTTKRNLWICLATLYAPIVIIFYDVVIFKRWIVFRGVFHRGVFRGDKLWLWSTLPR